MPARKAPEVEAQAPPGSSDPPPDPTPPDMTTSYSGLPEGTHAGLGGVHGTITIPSGGSYSTDDPVEQGFIEGVLGGTAD